VGVPLPNGGRADPLGPRSAFARQLRRDRPDWPMPASPPVESAMTINMKTKAALEAPSAKDQASASAQKPWRAKPDLHHCDQSCRREIGFLTPALSATFGRRGSRLARLNTCKHELLRRVDRAAAREMTCEVPGSRRTGVSSVVWKVGDGWGSFARGTRGRGAMDLTGGAESQTLGGRILSRKVCEAEAANRSWAAQREHRGRRAGLAAMSLNELQNA
jgi:hypothetical protein